MKQSGSWEEVVHASVVGSTDLDVDHIGTPVMVKGAFYKAYEAHTSKEALSHYKKIVAEWGYPVLVQEVVEGDELNVVAVGDGEGGRSYKTNHLQALFRSAVADP